MPWRNYDALRRTLTSPEGELLHQRLGIAGLPSGY
jgi:hypothetical protein